MTLLNEYLTKVASYDDDMENYTRAYHTIHDPSVSSAHRLRAYKDLTKMEASQDRKSRLTHGIGGALVGGGLGAVIGGAKPAPGGFHSKAALIGGGIGAGLGALSGIGIANAHNKMVERAKGRIGMSDDDLEHDMIRRAANRRAEKESERDAERRIDRYHRYERDYRRDKLLRQAVANGSRPVISI